MGVAVVLVVVAAATVVMVVAATVVATVVVMEEVEIVAPLVYTARKVPFVADSHAMLPPAPAKPS